MGDHSRFSPSNSKRWLNCSMSMTLPEVEQRGTTDYAKRGTALHALAEKILLSEDVGEHFVHDGYIATVDDIQHTVIPYVEYIDELDVDIRFVEQKVFLSEDCYGTADFIGYNTKTGALHVVDLKCGQGVMVYAKDNTQMQIYAIGAINFLLDTLPNFTTNKISKVITHVVQPGINNYGVQEVSAQELKELHDKVITTINMIKANDGQWSPGEEECRWCPHKVSCPKLHEIAQQAAANEFQDLELADKMKMVPALKQFISAVEDESFKVLNEGKDLPGFKLIRGKGRRTWKDKKQTWEALSTFAQNYEEGPTNFYDMIHTQPELLSIAKMEKVFKANKIDFDLGPLVEKKEGAPKVVLESHPQKAIDKIEDAKDAFKEVTNANDTERTK